MSRLAYYINYNEVDLTDIVKVRTVEIPSLPNISHSSVDIFERNGNLYNGASYNERKIKLTFIIKPDDPSEYDFYVNDVKRAFYTKEEAKLYCGDETLYMWCVPVDDVIITELGDACAEAEVNLVAYDPYWYDEEENIVNNENSKIFIVENKSDTEVYPYINIGFTKDCKFIELANGSNGERMLIGQIPTKEKDDKKNSDLILRDPMESTSGWVATTAPLDTGRSTGGTLTVTSSGEGLMAGDFGNATAGVTWHGACYKKSLSTPLEDFKVRIRMSHNSTGINGDPYHPYENDAGSGVEPVPKTYYKVTSKTLNIRKSASNKATKLCSMPYGTKVTPIQIKNNWAKVKYKSYEGWCYAGYLKKYKSASAKTSSECNFVTVKRCAIRSSASKSSTNLYTIPAGKCIRVFTSTKYPTSGDKKSTYYHMAKAYKGHKGYVAVENLVEANNYEVEYDPELNTADDKTGVCELYGYSANNVQLFKLSMVDDNEYYDFAYPLIRKNSADFLKDKTVAPKPKTRTIYTGDTKKVENVLSGKIGSWNEFYGELYIERLNNRWSAYVKKIKDGNVVKTIKSKTVVDKNNSEEVLSYLVMYVGTTGDANKACGMAISHIEVKKSNKGHASANQDNTTNVTYNWEEFEDGDILEIDCSVPSVALNKVPCDELVDVGSQFFPLEVGENIIKVSSDDTPNVDITWQNKYL